MDIMTEFTSIKYDVISDIVFKMSIMSKQLLHIKFSNILAHFLNSYQYNVIHKNNLVGTFQLLDMLEST
jgi:hypothetical protein